MHSRLRNIFTFAVALTASQTAHAAESRWAGGNGTWSNPNGWVPAMPTATTDVLFDSASPQPYTVSIPASPTATAAKLTVGTDNLTLALNDRTLALAGPLVLAPDPGDAAQLGFNFGGTLTSSAAAFSTIASVGAAGTLALSGSTVALTGPLRVGAGGAGSVLFTERSNLTASHIEIAATLTSVGTLNATYTLVDTRQQTPPQMNVGSLYVGGSDAGPGGIGTFSTNARTTIAGILKVYDTGPNSPDGTRVHLSGGTLSVGAIDTSGNPSRFNWTAGRLHLTNSSLDVSPSGPIGSTLSISPQTSGTWTLRKDLAVSGTLSIATGSSVTVGATPHVASTLAAAAIVNHGTLTQSGGSIETPALTNTGTADLAGTLNLAAGSSITNSGGTLTLRSPVGTASAFAATLTASGGLVQFAASQQLASLHLSASASAAISPGGSFAIETQSLSVAPTSKFDLNDNPLILHYAGTSPVDQIRAALASGSLTSTTPDTYDTHSLAYADSGTRVTVRLALTGDANLDGTVDLDDYTLLDRGLAAGGQYWWQGDFDYDGLVTRDDHLLLDIAYFRANPPISSHLAARASQFGPEYVTKLLAAIPEPTATFLLFGLLLPRRNRRPVPPLRTNRISISPHAPLTPPCRPVP